MRRVILSVCVVLPFAVGAAWAGEPAAAPAAAPAAKPAAAPDAALGKRQFVPCGACHSIAANAPNKVGPNLYGVLGRTAGAVANYNYSDTMKKSGVVWDEANLDKYIAKPLEFMRGNKMAFPGIQNADTRANIIAYIKDASK